MEPSREVIPQVGMRVKAFHPLKLGVIDHGTVVKLSEHTALIDYGIYGRYWTLNSHITEEVK